MIFEVLKHVQKIASLREWLNILVMISVTCVAYALRTPPGTPSRPAALFTFILSSVTLFDGAVESVLQEMV